MVPEAGRASDQQGGRDFAVEGVGPGAGKKRVRGKTCGPVGAGRLRKESARRTGRPHGEEDSGVSAGRLRERDRTGFVRSVAAARHRETRAPRDRVRNAAGRRRGDELRREEEERKSAQRAGPSRRFRDRTGRRARHRHRYGQHTRTASPSRDANSSTRAHSPGAGRGGETYRVGSVDAKEARPTAGRAGRGGGAVRERIVRIRLYVKSRSASTTGIPMYAPTR